MSTSKSAPSMRVFSIWLRNVLHATTACTFSTSHLPKVLRRWCFVWFCFEMCFAPQRRAIVHLSSAQMAPHPPLWRAYFSTFWSHKSLGKRSVSRLFYLFAHLHLLSSDSFSSRISFLLLFSSVILPTSAFPSAHVVGSLTSKLPSIIHNHTDWTRMNSSNKIPIWVKCVPHLPGEGL